MSQEPAEKEEPQSISADEEAPSLEFLEFLGEFETEDGNWTGPVELEVMEIENSEQKEDEEK